MQHSQIVTEEIIHVNAEYAEQRYLIPELLFRLISASVQNPPGLRIPFGGSVGQHGWDGIVVSPNPFDPYVPKGQSFWEIGVGGDPKEKATNDFKTRTENTKTEEQESSVFIFVTARSAYHIWDVDAQRKWIDERKRSSSWSDIRIIDATMLAQWLYFFPGIEFWLAEKFGLATKGLSTPELYWNDLKRYGAPPELKPDVFLIGREKAKEELLKVLSGGARELLLETRYPQEGVDFVVAALASLDEKQFIASASRCMIIDNHDTWKTMCRLQMAHVFVATPSLDMISTGADLRQQAINSGHSVIFAATSTGVTLGNKVQLPEAKAYEMEKTLEASGYPPERARTVSNQSNGKITVLKRILLNHLSPLPEWALEDNASELALACLIGQWDGHSKGDIEAATGIVGKSYEEWVRTVRPMTLLPDPPMIQRNEKWRFISRFEGWQYLGKYISDADLDRFSKQALSVLSEKNPKFSLPKEDRWAASVRGKTSKFSEAIKEGLAETLALMGSFPESLSSCSIGKPRFVCDSLVRTVLKESDWMCWASLNDILPMLAEASPDEFLRSIDEKLNDKDNKLFHDIFSQESNGVGGWNYMTGVLWALETLAWSAEHLTRVTLIFGHLAENDLKLTNWVNRPSNSLSTIFLPWRPQTCASTAKGKAALEALLREHPNAAWDLLLSLMPNSMQFTTDSRRPSWREFIPVDFSQTVLRKDYFERVGIYAGLIVKAAKGDTKKLSQVIDHLPNLPPEACSEVLKELSSESVLSMDENDKLILWEGLVSLVAKHRKFSDTDWAMSSDQVDQIEEVTKKLEPLRPQFLHRRLFSDQDIYLYEENENWEEQFRKLQNRRSTAVKEIVDSVGIIGLLDFAKSVGQPYQVGLSFGEIATLEQDVVLLPRYLISDNPSTRDVINGYVVSRYFFKGEGWVDGIDFNNWKEDEEVAFLILFPFVKTTWTRAVKLLGSNEALYWKQVRVNPYQTKEDLTEGIEQLLRNGRSWAALECLYRMIFDKREVSLSQVYRALLPEPPDENPPHSHDAYSLTEVIKWLQGKPEADRTLLFRIEWGYLRLLDHHHGQEPQALERQLAEDPGFFCEVLKIVYRSEKDKGVPRELDEHGKARWRNAYELLANWSRSPGTKDDGSFDGTELYRWVEAAKKLCADSEREKPALSQIGEVLAHAPQDPDGLWKHKAVAEILDMPEHDEMRSGFITRLINKRGVYWVNHGETDKSIAKDYHAKADSFDDRGFARLAASLHRLAKYYEEEAKRAAERDLLEE
jgi:hypothetical protein